ncbi:hypothetical protein FQ087_21685 [Sporosarcina sp. ANT_H38]|uniref:hypothetical protein n=1 Tax=Sporosarcina sp. ANT_H38 TaxID=2597358 RepID=UPI0011F1507F|nr:hypothetical protein [Sporosarcina sp. ANT_H38]KAA0941056.1 hypothetical protein FQ087_21685 [Sporosarcina sp. ANT_H38]
MTLAQTVMVTGETIMAFAQTVMTSARTITTNCINRHTSPNNRPFFILKKHSLRRRECFFYNLLSNYWTVVPVFH